MDVKDKVTRFNAAATYDVQRLLPDALLSAALSCNAAGLLAIDAAIQRRIADLVLSGDTPDAALLEVTVVIRS